MNNVTSIPKFETPFEQNKIFVCSFPGCNKRYPKECRLKVHQRTHSGEKPFVCEYEGCGKRFSEKGNLKTHIRIHTGEKPYYKMIYLIHPYLCKFEECGRRFTTQGHLNDHERGHYDEKPFSCSVCSKSFMRSSTLKAHMRDHTGERPFRCNKCTKNFKEARSLRSHMKIHSKDSDEVKEEPKEILKPIPQYREIDMKEELVSTMLSEDLNKSCAIENLVDKKANKLALCEIKTDEFSKEIKSDVYNDFSSLYQNCMLPRPEESYCLDHNPIILPMSKYFESMQGFMNYTSYPASQNYTSNPQFEYSRKKAIDHLSLQIMSNFI